jgi:hypothetical protein
MRSAVERFLERGPLERLPRRTADRLEVLDHVARHVLSADEDVDEPELNLRLRRFTDDAAMLRRALVDHGFVSRLPEGTGYRRAGPARL